jgi:release factor glutamine methyltransferase
MNQTFNSEGIEKFNEMFRLWSKDIRQCHREIRWMVDELMLRRGRGETGPNRIDERIIRDTLTEKELAKLQYWIESRHRNKPLQYILGHQPFLNHSIIVRPPVLIPRWETEEIVDRILKSTDKTKEMRILDLCCGSGCISIALADHLPKATVDGVDISDACIRLSKLNARRNLKDVSRVSFHQADIMSTELERFEKYDLVVCNPPYVKPSEYASLDADVKEWESPVALVTSDQDGVEFYERVAGASFLFRSSAKLVFEIGESQGELVKEIVEKHGFTSTIFQDLAGRVRSVEGQL